VTINNRFGVLLAEKRAREKRNISFVEVARETGIHRKTLLAWANNSVSRFDAPVINALCSYFDCQPGALFEYVPDQVEPTGN